MLKNEYKKHALQQEIAFFSMLFFFIGILCFSSTMACAETKDLGNGFADHGVAAPISSSRGIVATVDGQGRNVALILLEDCRGGYAILMIDADTGSSEEFPMPFDLGGDSPFASLLSDNNKLYVHFNSHFCEFDPLERAFTFFRKTTPKTAMSMTQDDQGVIWSVTYPQSGVVSFNPKTRELKDYGPVHCENWPQYQRSVAADDAGWIYFSIGKAASQIIAFDPRTGKAMPMLAEAERSQGDAYVYRGLDGKVYGHNSGATKGWYMFHDGKGEKIDKNDAKHIKPIITGAQDLFHQQFPNGKRLAGCDLTERVLAVQDPQTNAMQYLKFDYTSEGAHIMALAVAPDSTICGGTAFPTRFFSYNPKTDQWVRRAAYRQWNALANVDGRFFVGIYPGGYLLEWDPACDWVPTERGRKDSNPLFLTRCSPQIDRPHELLGCSDGKTIVLSGSPDYGLTGGGLLFWDRTSGEKILLDHTAIIPEHTTMSLVALPGGKLLGGTSTRPGSGGERKAKEAELYIIDMPSKKIEWHTALFPGAQEYTDLCMGPDGLVYGLTGFSAWDSGQLEYGKRFFVFDPIRLSLTHDSETESEFGPVSYQQGPRNLLAGPDGRIYVLFMKGIACVDPISYKLTLMAKSPVPIKTGGDILDGRIYFANGSHLFSFQIPGSDIPIAGRKSLAVQPEILKTQSPANALSKE